MPTGLSGALRIAPCLAPVAGFGPGLNPKSCGLPGYPTTARSVPYVYHLDGRTIYDLKVVESAHPDAIRRHMMTFGSHIQAAAYTRAVEQLRPKLAGRVRFVFLFAEVDTGFVHPVTLGGSMRELGRQQWVRACFAWSNCLASGKWPGYGPTTIEAPAWALAAEEEACDAMRRIPVTVKEAIDG